MQPEIVDLICVRIGSRPEKQNAQKEDTEAQRIQIEPLGKGLL